MKTLKLLLTSAVTAMLLLATSVSFAECGDPGPNPEPGTRPPWAGTMCSGDELTALDPADVTQDAVQPEDTSCNGQCGGQCGEGEQHKYGLQE